MARFLILLSLVGLATSDIPSIAELNVGSLFAAHKNPAKCVRPIIFIAARTPNGLSFKKQQCRDEARNILFSQSSS
jgi:hypothetical protein